MKISIVTPSFRQLDWLTLCAASVFDQFQEHPVPGLEIEHVVQDGGTDGIHEWKKDFVAAHPLPANYKLEVFSEKDEGMYDAINRGLRHTTGEICSYLNCDEQYLPGALREIITFFAQHPKTEVLFGDAVLIDTEGRPLSYRRIITPWRAHLEMAPLNTLTCATFFRRSIIQRNHFFPTNLKIAGDQLWIYRMLKAGISISVLSKPLAVFTFTGQNLSQSDHALYESKNWLPPEERTQPEFLKLPIIFWHRIRKLISGAYVMRDLSIEIFTKDSPLRRKKIEAKGIGFTWPA